MRNSLVIAFHKEGIFPSNKINSQDKIIESAQRRALEAAVVSLYPSLIAVSTTNDIINRSNEPSMTSRFTHSVHGSDAQEAIEILKTHTPEKSAVALITQCSAMKRAAEDADIQVVDAPDLYGISDAIYRMSLDHN